jgi:hypothetical protein
MTVPIASFDDFLDGTARGASLDTLVKKFNLSRNVNETDAALLARLQVAVLGRTLGPARYF